MLSTLRELPPKGSIQESVLIILHFKQEEINHARLRALSQILMDKEKGIEAFEAYMKSAFPWIESSKNRDRASQIKKLQEEVNKGPMSVQPLWQKPIKSRLKAKLEVPGFSKKEMDEANSLYKKMGRVIPR